MKLLNLRFAYCEIWREILELFYLLVELLSQCSVTANILTTSPRDMFLQFYTALYLDTAGSL